MVTGVSSAISAAYSSSITQQPVQKPASAPSQSSAPQDTVTLSSTAQTVASSGDLNHDGDSR